MRRKLIAIAALTVALATTACSTATGTGSVQITSGPSPSPLPSDSSGTVVSPSGSLPPTGPPGVTGAVTHGQATLSLTGGLTQTTALPTLGTPAIWSPSPGSMALSWTGLDTTESMSLGGPSFIGQQSTSPTFRLAFSVKTTKGAMAFRSQAGECSVTLNPVLATQVGGLISCTNLKSVDTTLTVNVQGSFSAAG